MPYIPTEHGVRATHIELSTSQSVQTTAAHGHFFARHLAKMCKNADLRHARNSHSYAYIKRAEQEQVS
jgi:hypothetical protein